MRGVRVWLVSREETENFSARYFGRWVQIEMMRGCLNWGGWRAQRGFQGFVEMTDNDRV